MPLRTVAVTGATGFIGNALARRFHADGWQVRALIRRPRESTNLHPLPIQTIRGALDDVNSLCRLVEGVEVVVHCAGRIRGASQSAFDRVNVDGVARLVNAVMEQRPCPCFVLLSSVAAREPALSSYAASKYQGEGILASMAGTIEWTILRPPAVYGPGDRGLRPLFQWIGCGIAPILGPSHARFSLIFVDDLVEAVVRVIARGRHARRIFELHDGYPGGYGWNDVIDAVGRLRRRPVVRINVPERLLQLLAGLNVGISRCVGYAPMLTPGKVRELRHHDWVCDNTDLSRATGWMPRVSLEAGLKETFGWGANAHGSI